MLVLLRRALPCQRNEEATGVNLNIYSPAVESGVGGWSLHSVLQQSEWVTSVKCYANDICTKLNVTLM